MLTMLFVVRWKRGELPKNRGELFGFFTDSLLKREGLAAWDAEGKQLLAGLANLAWRMQTDRIAEDQSEDGQIGLHA